MGRYPVGDDENTVKPHVFHHRLQAVPVSQMDRVKGPAEDTNPHSSLISTILRTSFQMRIGPAFRSALVHVAAGRTRLEFRGGLGGRVRRGGFGSVLGSHARENRVLVDFRFLGGRRLHVAEIVERTIMNMKLLDFYGMLDEVMAEHLGAIQVFGFILGAAIGYVQYAVSVIATGHSVLSYLLIVVPVLLIGGAKVCMTGLARSDKDTVS